jgi:putative lipoprotein
MRHRFLFLLFWAAVVAPAAAASLSGSAYHGELLLWPRDAVFEADLLDLSQGDNAPALLSRVRIDKPAPGIVSFVLDYDPARIRPGGRYVLDARVTVQGQTWFVAERRPALFVSDQPEPAVWTLHMVRVPLPTGGAPAAASAPLPPPVPHLAPLPRSPKE